MHLWPVLVGGNTFTHTHPFNNQMESGFKQRRSVVWRVNQTPCKHSHIYECFHIVRKGHTLCSHIQTLQCHKEDSRSLSPRPDTSVHLGSRTKNPSPSTTLPPLNSQHDLDSIMSSVNTSLRHVTAFYSTSFAVVLTCRMCLSCGDAFYRFTGGR